MRILHLNALRELSEGQRKQLRYEQKAAERMDGIEWETVAFQINSPVDSFERQYPRLFRLLFLRKFYAWIFLLHVHSSYDVVLLRYMVFDPFVLIFGFLIRNRFTIHHSKEIEELKLVRLDWRGRAASLLERFTGFVNSRQVKGFVGVTRDIAKYQIRINGAKCPAGFYPNGVDTNQVDILEDRRDEDINIAFVCGKFTPWHGLDRLVQAAWDYEANPSRDVRITIHLIGTLNHEQMVFVSDRVLSHSTIVCHGHKNHEEYRVILAKCDIGLGSLALDRQNLSEGTVLKVREYLALGLPVYSAFLDAAIPDNFLYYRRGPIILESMITYALEMKSCPRLRIRNASRPYIEKFNNMMNLKRWLEKEAFRS
jgi:hypothetical protein